MQELIVLVMAKEYLRVQYLYCQRLIGRVFPIEEKSLEDFMGILSASSKADAVAPLKVGTYTLDSKASAYIDGDKLFNVMRRY